MSNPVNRSKTVKEDKKKAKNEEEKKIQRVNTLVRNSKGIYSSIYSF